MFKILCLTTGSDICWPQRMYYVSTKVIPTVVSDDIIDLEITASLGSIIYFKTREQAEWLVKRRLSYNTKRTDKHKLDFMNSLFKASGMEDIHFSKSHMFDIIEV